MIKIPKHAMVLTNTISLYIHVHTYLFFFSSTMPKIRSPIIAKRTSAPTIKKILCWTILGDGWVGNEGGTKEGERTGGRERGGRKR